jgi:hypothetical protein
VAKYELLHVALWSQSFAFLRTRRACWNLHAWEDEETVHTAEQWSFEI